MFTEIHALKIVYKNKAVILNHWFIIYHIQNMIFNYWCLVKCWLVVPQARVTDDYCLPRQVIYYDTVICFLMSNDGIVFSKINNPDFILGNKHPFWLYFLIYLQKCFKCLLLICQYLLICHVLFVLMPHQFINSLQVHLSYIFSFSLSCFCFCFIINEKNWLVSMAIL